MKSNDWLFQGFDTIVSAKSVNSQSDFFMFTFLPNNGTFLSCQKTHSTLRTNFPWCYIFLQSNKRICKQNTHTCQCYDYLMSLGCLDRNDWNWNMLIYSLIVTNGCKMGELSPTSVLPIPSVLSRSHPSVILMSDPQIFTTASCTVLMPCTD